MVIYIVFLIGPIAGLDFPAIVAAIKANPIQLVQFLIIGISNGAIIAIIALGYTMVYGIIELINFAALAARRLTSLQQPASTLIPTPES